jgi:hypothetical protein
MARSFRINRNHKKHQSRGTRRHIGRGNGRISNNVGAGIGATLGLIGSLVGAAALSQGSELDNHQNQESEQSSTTMTMSGGKRGRVDRKGMRNNNDNDGLRNCAEYIVCFLEMLNTIKIYHWSTLSYPTHKATDKLYEKLSELVDSFIEIYIGHLARPSNSAGSSGRGGVPIFKKGIKSIPFCGCKSLDEFCKTLDGNIFFMEELSDKLDGYTDLMNIRDEMVGEIAQALYLLRLT